MSVSIINHLTDRLTSGDDPQIWKIAVETFLDDVEVKIQESSFRRPVYLVVGCCSSWLRPHQTRFSGGGGFAWPAGYGGSRYSRTGLPEFDWFESFLRHRRGEWGRSTPPRLRKRRQVIARLAVPARTARHSKASVHGLLMESPRKQEKSRSQLYFFRRSSKGWELITSNFSQRGWSGKLL